ncbi:MAG: 3-phosphoshikimate 1-carboxyvinyltransferase [Chloroflexi bacterium]|nr:3-phosphoshikimate 1-carboxyvinyltransferase [Chloroflexota bacterium]
MAVPATRAGATSAGPEPTATILPARRLAGTLTVPGDKSISHRALMLALVAEGESRIEGAGDGADVRSTAGIVAALGASVERTDDGLGGAAYLVRSRGAGGLLEPRGTLDCGNSGTSLRLFAGLLAGTPVAATLDGDASLRGRPMARIVEPLRAMGAGVVAAAGDRPPLTVRGRRPLSAIDWTTPVPSAQVKSAILLAGLGAEGTTRVRERVATRDHSERMLRARGIAVRSTMDGGGAMVVEIEGGTPVRAMDERVPGDPSAAAFWLVAGAIHPDAELRIGNVGVNPTRRAVIDLLVRMGARLEEAASASPGPDATAGDIGEPVADLIIRSSSLRGIDIGPAEVAAAIDEVPILCLAATQAEGRTTIRGGGELRHKESDRLAGIVAGLRALGARIEVEGEDLTIDGPVRLTGATTDSLDDHRLAMTFAIAGLIATGHTTVGRPASAAISYPGFFHDLERIRA